MNEKEMMQKLFDRIEELQWSVFIDTDDDLIQLTNTSPCGMEICVDIEVAEDCETLYFYIQSYGNDFDPSTEAYLWLDNSGHGTSGAPYEMGDIYQDMVHTKEMINELADNLADYYKELSEEIKDR